MNPERDPDAPTPPERDMLVPPPDTSPPRDGLLLPLVHALIQPYVEAARSHGPTPPLRSDAWLDAHPDQQIAHLLVIGMAGVLAAPHATVRALLKQTSNAVHGGDDDYWRRAANLHRRNVETRDQRERDQLEAEARAIIAEADARRAAEDRDRWVA